MWIEQRPLQFIPLESKPKGNAFIVQNQKQFIEINAHQHDYLTHLRKGMSIHGMVQEFIKKGSLVSFRELFQLLEMLVHRNWIMNPELQAYFPPQKGSAKNAFSASGIKTLPMSHGKVVANPDLLKSLPFFRQLDRELRDVFVSQAVIREVPTNTIICKMGELSRELFAMIDGLVGVYKTLENGRRQLINTIPKGSIFGEGGFLLNQPRSADVVAMQASTIAIIPHCAQMDALTQAGKAEALQTRFWVLQGLLASELFKSLPSESLDSLIFAGKVIHVKKDEVLAKEGEPGSSFFIIIQGQIAFSKAQKPLRQLSQGEIFGEIALMVSGGKRTATAMAASDAILLRIEMPEFYELLSKHIFLAKEIESVAWQRWETQKKNSSH